MHYTFIEIGTSDRDVVSYTMKDTDQGISVEPFKDHFDKLPERDNLIRVNKAISDKPGTMEMFYLSDATIVEYNMPHWVGGCRSIEGPHKTVVKLMQRRNIPQDLWKKQEIDIQTYVYLMEEYDVTSIDYLKVDTEGHDHIILKNMLMFCADNPEAYPTKIKYEDNELTSREDRQNTLNLLKEAGYVVIGRPVNNCIVERK